MEKEETTVFKLENGIQQSMEKEEITRTRSIQLPSARAGSWMNKFHRSKRLPLLSLLLGRVLVAAPFVFDNVKSTALSLSGWSR